MYCQFGVVQWFNAYATLYIPDPPDQHFHDHCLVDFKAEDCIGVVHIKNIINIKDQPVVVGVNRTIKCSKGKFDGLILAIGMLQSCCTNAYCANLGTKDEMERKEKELTEDSEQELVSIMLIQFRGCRRIPWDILVEECKC